jgi:hypothetical protein
MKQNEYLGPGLGQSKVRDHKRKAKCDLGLDHVFILELCSYLLQLEVEASIFFCFGVMVLIPLAGSRGIHFL